MPSVKIKREKKVDTVDTVDGQSRQGTPVIFTGEGPLKYFRNLHIGQPMVSQAVPLTAAYLINDGV